MDLFQHRYYRINKTLMMLGGTWPYQSSRVRVTVTIFLLSGLGTLVVPQILALVKYRHSPTILFECVLAFLFEAICTTKGLCMLFNVRKTRTLLDRIRTDWQVWARDPEVNVLHEYAEQGRRMTIVYTGQSSMVEDRSAIEKSLTDLSALYIAGIYGAIIVYALEPVMPTVVDVLLKNGTAPRRFPSPVDFYYFDAQKYYWYIVVHTYTCLCTGLIAMVAGEVMMIIFVRHVCGIFEALGLKFQRIGNKNVSDKSGGTPYALDMVEFPSCIDRHNDAIKFANLIEASYTWNIFIVTGIGMILLNLTGLQILLTRSSSESTVRYISIGLGAVVHLYVQCSFSENLMDRSTRVHSCVHKSQWYNLSPEAQKPIRLMMMLCQVLCQLTAGRYVTLSMRSFGQAARAAMSYFTLVRSMQNQ